MRRPAAPPKLGIRVGRNGGAGRAGEGPQCPRQRLAPGGRPRGRAREEGRPPAPPGNFGGGDEAGGPAPPAGMLRAPPRSRSGEGRARFPPPGGALGSPRPRAPTACSAAASGHRSPPASRSRLLLRHPPPGRGRGWAEEGAAPLKNGVGLLPGEGRDPGPSPSAAAQAPGEQGGARPCAPAPALGERQARGGVQRPSVAPGATNAPSQPGRGRSGTSAPRVFVSQPPVLWTWLNPHVPETPPPPPPPGEPVLNHNSGLGPGTLSPAFPQSAAARHPPLATTGQLWLHKRPPWSDCELPKAEVPTRPGTH